MSFTGKSDCRTNHAPIPRCRWRIDNPPSLRPATVTAEGCHGRETGVTRPTIVERQPLLTSGCNCNNADRVSCCWRGLGFSLAVRPLRRPDRLLGIMVATIAGNPLTAAYRASLDIAPVDLLPPRRYAAVWAILVIFHVSSLLVLGFESLHATRR